MITRSVFSVLEKGEELRVWMTWVRSKGPGEGAGRGQGAIVRLDVF